MDCLFVFKVKRCQVSIMLFICFIELISFTKTFCYIIGQVLEKKIFVCFFHICLSFVWQLVQYGGRCGYIISGPGLLFFVKEYFQLDCCVLSFAFFLCFRCFFFFFFSSSFLVFSFWLDIARAVSMMIANVTANAIVSHFHHFTQSQYMVHFL